MAGADARIRISLSAGELELEGSPEFIAKYESLIDVLVDRLKDVPSVVGRGSGQGTGNPDPAEAGTGNGGGGDDRDFGEVLQRLPKNAAGTDQILVAGWHTQRSSSDSSFTTADANRLLVGQGIKLSNAAQAMRSNLASKRVFKVSGNRWRISRQGDDHVKSLIGS